MKYLAMVLFYGSLPQHSNIQTSNGTQIFMMVMIVMIILTSTNMQTT